MGTYLGVNSVVENGKQVIPSDVQPIVNNGKFLVAVVCNGVWSIAPEVTDKREYDAFYDSYRQGNWLSFKLYEVNESDRDKCPDEGRVPCSYR